MDEDVTVGTEVILALWTFVTPKWAHPFAYCTRRRRYSEWCCATGTVWKRGSVVYLQSRWLTEYQNALPSRNRIGQKKRNEYRWSGD